MGNMGKQILIHGNKEDDIVLRQTTALFDFSLFTKKEIRELVKMMRMTMKKADGVGLSANQIGLNLRLFVAQIERKFYAVFNPVIVKTLLAVDEMEEGCLSVPGVFGLVERPSKIWVAAQDMNGKKVNIKAWGFLARVFQHEIDHLNGILFIDTAKELHHIKHKK